MRNNFVIFDSNYMLLLIVFNSSQYPILVHTLHDYQNVLSVPPQDLTRMMSNPTKFGLLEVKEKLHFSEKEGW